MSMMLEERQDTDQTHVLRVGCRSIALLHGFVAPRLVAEQSGLRVEQSVFHVAHLATINPFPAAPVSHSEQRTPNTPTLSVLEIMLVHSSLGPPLAWVAVKF